MANFHHATEHFLPANKLKISLRLLAWRDPLVATHVLGQLSVPAWHSSVQYVGQIFIHLSFRMRIRRAWGFAEVFMDSPLKNFEESLSIKVNWIK